MKLRITRILIVAMAYPSIAFAHDWYPAACCSGQDCARVSDDSITLTDTGWLIHATGEVIPFSKAESSPDGNFHRCRYSHSDPTSRTRCLFVPNQGS